MNMPQSDILSKKPLRCLVTGGLGYAGAWISRLLAACGHEVFILTRHARKNELDVPYSLIQADLTALAPEELALKLPEGLDGVVHAASHNESFAPDYASKALMANGFGTRNLLQAIMLRSKADTMAPPLVIYPSTFHVYGKSEGEICENTPPLPSNDYALTHFFAEEYCRFFARSQSLPHIVLRISNGYGAPKTSGSNKWYLLLNDLCRMAVLDGEIRLHSAPSVCRDFVWLGDVATVIEKLLHRRDLAGRIFNVASGKCRSTGDVASLVAHVASRQLARHIPVIALPAGSSLQKPMLAINNRAVREAVGMIFQDRMAEEISSLLLLASFGSNM